MFTLMKVISGFRKDHRASVVVQLRRLRKDERGATSIIMGFLMVPLAGFLALGFEVSNWYSITRGMQNAADAATLAAATNNSDILVGALPAYEAEAKAVAATYGFVNGVNNVTINVKNDQICPLTGDTNCYSVQISGYTPLLLSQVVGFQGDGNVNGSLQKQLSAVAVAKPSSPQDICVLALADSGASPAIHTNGAPKSNLNGCNTLSYTGSDCNGHNLGIGTSFTVGSFNSGCGAKQLTNQSPPPPKDPYAQQVTANISNFASNPCNNKFPQEPVKKNDPPLPSGNPPSGNQPSGTISLPSGNTYWCGDQWLSGDVTIDTPPTGGAVLVIENGQLDLNGHSFTTDTACNPPAVQTSCSSGLTIVFTGSDNTRVHTLASNSGTLDITPPTTGPWKGMAIVQDPSLPDTNGNLDISAAGNSPTLNITGLIYMPHASITLKGAIDASNKGNGNRCLVLVADNVLIDGTGGFLKANPTQCPSAGLTTPTVPLGKIGLVL
jgi:Putative Flp pilus-assembly TadE/G-like